MLVTGISPFFFSHKVFKGLFPLGLLKFMIVWWRVSTKRYVRIVFYAAVKYGPTYAMELKYTSPITTQSQLLMTLGKRYLENNVGKGKNAAESPQHFLPYQRKIAS